MSASLVGSEMCIRDSSFPVCSGQLACRAIGGARCWGCGCLRRCVPLLGGVLFSALSRFAFCDPR
eukprot:8877180-Alexandrium_andersonii.AAC.1